MVGTREWLCAALFPKRLRTSATADGRSAQERRISAKQAERRQSAQRNHAHHMSLRGEWRAVRGCQSSGCATHRSWGRLHKACRKSTVGNRLGMKDRRPIRSRSNRPGPFRPLCRTPLRQPGRSAASNRFHYPGRGKKPGRRRLSNRSKDS